MTRIRFEDLPSTNTPRNSENLNKLNNVIISPTEPTTGEEVWIDDSHKKLYTKNDNGVYKEFYNEDSIKNDINNMQPKNTAFKCSPLREVEPNTTTTFEIYSNWGFIFLYNEWGNFGLYVYNWQSAGTRQMTIHTIKGSDMITVSGEANTRNIKFTAGQIRCIAYNIYF